MKNSVILGDKDKNEMHLLLHPFTRERKKKKRKKKNENAKKRKRIFSRTNTHIFKNEDAKKKKKKKTKTKTQILGERCQLSSGEYCMRTGEYHGRYI